LEIRSAERKVENGLFVLFFIVWFSHRDVKVAGFNALDVEPIFLCAKQPPCFQCYYRCIDYEIVSDFSDEQMYHSGGQDRKR
jgi:hypothetical protein